MAIVTLNRKSILQFGGAVLMPGSNEVKEPILSALLAHPLIQVEIKKGLIVVDKKHEDITKLSEKDAIAFVRQATVPRILFECKEKETRKKVLKAIEECINAFKPKEEE